MARTFTREELYELVWSKPITHLAKEFGLSDVALHKICKKHAIPNPPLGWWAKKHAGKSVKRVPLPRAKAGDATTISIAGGELRSEPDSISTARENARILAATVATGDNAKPHPIVERSAARLRRAKPDSITGLATVDQAGLIKIVAAPASADRLELALNRIAAVSQALGIEIAAGEKSAELRCDGEAIGFSITELTAREAHVLTPKEQKELDAWERKAERRRTRNDWGSWDYDWSRPKFPEWDYHPSGRLSFELEQCYCWGGGSPRRSYRDAKIQRLESMAADIAVGIAVLAAAKKAERLRREEQARREAEERRLRELALRARHIEERRDAALDQILEELGALDRLRRLLATFGEELTSTQSGRLGEFVELARRRLAAREAALSAVGLERRFETSRIFGEDDDHGFRAPYHY